MKNKSLNYFTIILASAFAFSSCAKKLDLAPLNDLTPEKTYSTENGYKSVLAKIYGTLATSGNSGPAGAPDISGGLDWTWRKVLPKPAVMKQPLKILMAAG